MDKIYTRRRIRLPKIKYACFSNGNDRKNRKLAIDLVIILIVAITTLCIIITSITPIIDRVCRDVAKGKATIVSNNMATEVMAKYDYDDLININKDKSGNITMIQSNIKTINEITSDVAVKIQEGLVTGDESDVIVKFRKFYRN